LGCGRHAAHPRGSLTSAVAAPLAPYYTFFFNPTLAAALWQFELGHRKMLLRQPARSPSVSERIACAAATTRRALRGHASSANSGIRYKAPPLTDCTAFHPRQRTMHNTTGRRFPATANCVWGLQEPARSHKASNSSLSAGPPLARSQDAHMHGSSSPPLSFGEHIMGRT